MAKGLLTALAAMMVCTVIPIAQLFLAPFGPFIGAYFGIKYVDTRGARPLAAAATFGAWLGAASALILILIALALMSTVDMAGRFVVLTWLAVAVFSFYVATMGTLGAWYRLVKSTVPAASTAPELG
jgi:hypothetical protein